MPVVGEARFGSLVAEGVQDVTDEVADLTAGFWVVVLTFEGRLTAVRMARVGRGATPDPDPPWHPLEGAWRSSLDRAGYLAGVEEVRRRIADGTVYQVNLCRVLEHDLPEDADLRGLGARLARGNPAPHEAVLHLPEAGLEVVCASPETFLHRAGDHVVSGPIKGTAADRTSFLRKDHAENVMIVDLVRNDLAHVGVPGTVAVDALCRVEEHPGLAHLVSEVSARLRPGTGWRDLLAATFPPGSVSGAPKHTALRTIADLEPVPRGPYCGAVGWLDADRGTARLAVGIRTFWAARRDDGGRVLRFGTGAGITWGSDPAAEWEETELKAARLVGLAAGRVPASGTV